MDQINTNELKKIAFKIRQEFVQKNINKQLLERLYYQYNPVPAIEAFITEALQIFPSLNCGIATVYLKHLLQKGTVVNGVFRDNNHTFLLLKQRTSIIIDITADQFGGPNVYVGKLVKPWAY